MSSIRLPKVLSKKTTKQEDFLREFDISYCLATHRSIIKTYDVAFESAAAFVFAQEYAPVCDLFEDITPQVATSLHYTAYTIRYTDWCYLKRMLQSKLLH